MNPKPLAPKWFYDMMYEETQTDFVTEAFVQRVWERLMAKGNHTCDPFFHIWELHIPTYFPRDDYKPDQY